MWYSLLKSGQKERSDSDVMIAEIIAAIISAILAILSGLTSWEGLGGGGSISVRGHYTTLGLLRQVSGADT